MATRIGKQICKICKACYYLINKSRNVHRVRCEAHAKYQRRILPHKIRDELFQLLVNFQCPWRKETVNNKDRIQSYIQACSFNLIFCNDDHKFDLNLASAINYLDIQLLQNAVPAEFQYITSQASFRILHNTFTCKSHEVYTFTHDPATRQCKHLQCEGSETIPV